jgi:integrase
MRCYLSGLLAWLCDEYGEKLVTDVGSDDIGSFMRRHETKGRPYNNLRGLLVVFWRWCQRENFYPRQAELPTAKLEMKTEFDEEPEVFLPAQLQLLLEKLKPETRAHDWVMLGAFFGLRAAEVLRPEGVDLQVTHGVIEVKA